MFAFHAELAGLIRKDPAATVAERRRALDAISGVREDEARVSFGEAAEMLGFEKSTVYRLAKSRVLVAVRGAGKRPCGVTRSSVEAYAARRKLA